MNPIRVTIEDLTLRGEGIAKHDGITYFVQGGMLGEMLDILPLEKKKNYYTAKVERLVNASPLTRTPPCRHADICEGCPLMRLTKEAQTQWKKSHIENAFLRIGRIETDVKMRSFPEWHYRNKVNMRLTPEGKLGYTAGKDNTVFAVEECPVAKKGIEELIQTWNDNPPKDTEKVKMVILRENRKGETMVFLIAYPLEDQEREELFRSLSFLKADVLCLSENPKNNDIRPTQRMFFATQKRTLEERLFDLSFEISPQAFFQINEDSVEVLYDTAISLFSDLKDKTVTDLYCGTGTTTLILAQRAKHVVGIEWNKKACSNAIKNAEKNSITNVTFLQGKAEALIKEHAAKKVLVDPPRKGLDDRVVQAINRSNCEELVYISCNPATQARDCAKFLKEGFELKKLYGINQFANTSHVEIVGLLKR